VTARLVDWLGRSLLHDRTVALIVEPALADFAFEASTPAAGRRRRAQLGPWIAFVLAMWYDLAWDPRGPAWGRSMKVLLTLGLVVASYHASMLTLILGFDERWRNGISQQLSAVVSSHTSFTMMGMAFAFGVVWVARRAHDTDGPP
jgi:hypothetical protein